VQRRRRAATTPHQKRLLQQGLWLPDLHAQRNLRARHLGSGAPERAAFGKRDEAARQVDVEMTGRGVSVPDAAFRNISFP
jgi:hypothetical protein